MDFGHYHFIIASNPEADYINLWRKPQRWVDPLLLLTFLLLITCEPPEPPPPAPPDVTGAYLEQIDRGFKVTWTRLDSSEVDVIGYTIYRKDHDANSTSFYKEVDINVDSVLDVDSFNWPADSGKLYSYEIRSKNVDGIEGYPDTTQPKRLISIPIEISIIVEGSIRGIRNAPPKGYTDTTRVWVRTQVKRGDPSEVSISNDLFFTNATWQPYKDEYEHQLTPPDGRKDVYVLAKNLGGGLSDTASGSIILDTSPPSETSIKILPKKNDLYSIPEYKDEVVDYTPDKRVDIELKASDLAKWRAKIYNDSVDAPVDSTPWTSSNSILYSHILIDEPGLRKVFAQFEDTLGHVQKSPIPFDSITYDPFPPRSGTIVINIGQTVITTATYDEPIPEVALEITAQDSGDAGIFLMRLCNENDNCEIVPYEPEISWSLAPLEPTEGYAQRNVFAKFIDKSGNEGPTQPISDDIWINRSPDVVHNFQAEASYEQVRLSWDASIENDVQAGGIFIIEKAPAGQAYAPLDTLASSIREKTDTAVQNGVPYSYRIRAVDSTGLRGLDTTTTAIPRNQPPQVTTFTIESDTPIDSVGRRETIFRFSVNSNQARDDHTAFNVLRVQWRFKTGDEWSDMTTKKDTTYTYKYDTGNEFDVSLKVIDLDGADSVVTRGVRINQPPDQPTLTVNKNNVSKRENVLFTAHASDPDVSDVIEYYWFDFGDGDTTNWQWRDSTAEHAYQKSIGSPFNAFVKVKDKLGDISDESQAERITVINLKPNRPADIWFSPSNPNKGDDIRVYATVSDDDEDQVKLYTIWQGGFEDSSDTFVNSETEVYVTKANGYSSSGEKTITLLTGDEEYLRSTSVDTVIDVQNRPPNSATNLNPCSGSDVSIYTDLDWDSGGDPDPSDNLTFTVHFREQGGTWTTPCTGTSSTFCDNNNFGPLEYYTYYEWYVVTSDSEDDTSTGICTFRTGGADPVCASNPSPDDDETDIPIDTDLSWDPGYDPDGGTVYYKVYFEKDDSTPEDLLCETYLTNCDPGVLEPSSHYYWKVITYDDENDYCESDVWDFRTVNEVYIWIYRWNERYYVDTNHPFYNGNFYWSNGGYGPVDWENSCGLIDTVIWLDPNLFPSYVYLFDPGSEGIYVSNSTSSITIRWKAGEGIGGDGPKGTVTAENPICEPDGGPNWSGPPGCYDYTKTFSTCVPTGSQVQIKIGLDGLYSSGKIVFEEIKYTFHGWFALSAPKRKAGSLKASLKED